jgi:hypothetical protein
MGKDVARDVFPALLDFITRHSPERAAAERARPVAAHT